MRLLFWRANKDEEIDPAVSRDQYRFQCIVAISGKSIFDQLENE